MGDTANRSPWRTCLSNVLLDFKYKIFGRPTRDYRCLTIWMIVERSEIEETIDIDIPIRPPFRRRPK
ncbi:hypothetical protein IA69_09860 [Massilia sp. JS1662]|nr:hypothetical protein IA69_09860 [Massilia sp. JS1662]